MLFRSLRNRCIHLFVPPNVFHILVLGSNRVNVGLLVELCMCHQFKTYPCLLNNLVHNKPGNILYPVCIIYLLRTIELKCKISAKKVRFQAKMSSNVLELTSKC